MNDILIKFGLPIFSAIIAFFVAIYKSKLDLKKQIELNNMELQKVREQCINEIDKIKIQVDKQAELYEKNAQTDVIKSFINSALENPTKAAESLNGLMQVASTAEKFQNEYGKKKLR